MPVIDTLINNATTFILNTTSTPATTPTPSSHEDYLHRNQGWVIAIALLLMAAAFWLKSAEQKSSCCLCYLKPQANGAGVFHAGPNNAVVDVDGNDSDSDSDYSSGDDDGQNPLMQGKEPAYGAAG
ncbi:MAG: hypothetical protein K0U23_07385 [Gammaproteobacteria bacterium]|nr:hypothetical protein [Gammaproteobacteria bacterium]